MFITHLESYKASITKDIKDLERALGLAIAAFEKPQASGSG